MGFNLLSLMMSYQLWTLLSALFFPLVATIATFICLKRARTSRKMFGFFLIIPILVIIIAVFFSDMGSVTTDLLKLVGLTFPPVVGFLCSITLGIFCLNLTAIICGAGLFRKSGAIVNSVFSLIFFAGEVFITYHTWTRYVALSDLGMLRYDGGVIYIKEALPFLDLDFIPGFILESGIEILSLALLAIYLIVYYLTFIALKTPEEIAKEDLERRRRAALMNAETKKHSGSARSRKRDDEEDIECCGCCEHATALRGDKLKMVCDKCGVVATTHKCKKFLYDPLKRMAVRPKINPLSEEINELSGEEHI